MPHDLQGAFVINKKLRREEDKYGRHCVKTKVVDSNQYLHVLPPVVVIQLIEVLYVHVPESTRGFGELCHNLGGHHDERDEYQDNAVLNDTNNPDEVGLPASCSIDSNDGVGLVGIENDLGHINLHWTDVGHVPHVL